MMQMFGDFDEWSIVIFDNVLLLAHDEEDACRKLTTFLERCRKHNVFLKMSNSWFGFASSVKIMGYKVTYGKWEMDDDRTKCTTWSFKCRRVKETCRIFLERRYFLNLLFQTTPKSRQMVTCWAT